MGNNVERKETKIGPSEWLHAGRRRDEGSGFRGGAVVVRARGGEEA